MNKKISNEAYKLQLRQALDLESKMMITRQRIREFGVFAGENNLYTAFSGGEDSVVLNNEVRQVFPNTPAVFVNTGLEFPEIVARVKETSNTVFLKPKMGFKQVLDKYGFPLISKNVAMAISRYRNTKDPIQKEYRMFGTKKGKYVGQSGVIPKKYRYLIDAPFKISESCCDVMKKCPFKKYNKESGNLAFIGTMASDSDVRKKQVMKQGCNAFNLKVPHSNPLSFWTKEDIKAYSSVYNLKQAEVYDMGYEHTGCIFCMFGIIQESKKGENRFQRMFATHYKLWKYCMSVLGIQEVMDYIEIPTVPQELDILLNKRR